MTYLFNSCQVDGNGLQKQIMYQNKINYWAVAGAFFALLFLSLTVSSALAGVCKVNDSDISGDYSGGCVNGFANGKGKAIGRDTYIGNFKQGNKHGNGIYIWGISAWNGDKYEGEFKDDQFSGKAIKTYANGIRYEGDYKDNKMNGKGSLYFPETGSSFVGNFRNGMKHGHGIHTQPSGFFQPAGRIEGEWVDDQKVSGNFVADETSSSPSTSSAGFCSSSDTCFETISTSGDEVTLRCTKGNTVGQERKIRGPNSDGKWAYSLGGYHRRFREAGNFACE